MLTGKSIEAVAVNDIQSSNRAGTPRGLGTICVAEPEGADSREAAGVTGREHATPTFREGAGKSLALLVFENNHLCEVVRLGGRPVTVGRTPDCTIRLRDRNVSREHCIVREAAGKVLVADAGSTNGTFRHGRRVETATLREGDEITIGQALIKLVDLQSPEGEIDLALFENLFIDEPSGLLNRRGFRARIGARMAVLPPGTSFGVLLAALALFEQINLRHGYAAGRVTIAHVGRLLRESLPLNACAARLHFDELGVFVVDASRHEMSQLAGRLRDIVGTSPVSVDGATIDCSISIGVAAGVVQHGDLHPLFRAAGDALIRARACEGCRREHGAPRPVLPGMDLPVRGHAVPVSP